MTYYRLVLVLGILLQAVGAIAIGFAAITPPSFLSMPEFKAGHRRRIEIVDEARRKGYHHLPIEQRDTYLDQADADLRADLQRLEDGIASAYWADRATTSRWTLIGLALTIVGSACLLWDTAA
ncbi:hypothetical protein [Gordonia westfalica]|uniref:hypothetical protein n=1 Tax=Gordonia westfalica TaxID=158898 RepID=UPI0009447D81|nr:hypothetical protein [Gordonia westfalica]